MRSDVNFQISRAGWPDPNTGFDQSEHALYTCYFIIEFTHARETTIKREKVSILIGSKFISHYINKICT